MCSFFVPSFFDLKPYNCISGIWLFFRIDSAKSMIFCLNPLNERINKIANVFRQINTFLINQSSALTFIQTADKYLNMRSAATGILTVKSVGRISASSANIKNG